jgi:hypothetical protein
MFDARTLELFKACNKIHGDVTIEAFTSYVNGYTFINLDLDMSPSIPG